jgi:Asp-tRNA(Asn)/Glu-tRNA(Gln) amidotransferase A subunit family amidase
MLREIVQGVVDGRLAAVELVERALDRIRRLDGDLNAVVALRAEEALAEARDLDARERRGERLGPLAGVPFLVKDSMGLAGMRTTWGSLTRAESPLATRDDLSVARLRGAGAIAVGKTNVPEFCFEGFTANRLFGTTANPWASDWSPGGSSGGSAAAMAAGMVPFATATDGGGSIRIPASFCGLYGIKPTAGVVARDPAPDWMDFSTDGPLALSAADLRLLLGVQAGPSPGDPTALPFPLAVTGPPVRPSRLLAAPRLVDWGALPAGIEAAFAEALTRLEIALGMPVEHLGAADVLALAGVAANADDDWLTVAACEHAHGLGRAFIEANEARFHEAFLNAMRRGLAVPVEEYVAARRRRFAYVKALDELLGEDAILATPTMPSIGFLADGRMPGRDAPGTFADSYNTQVQNITGHPALSVPAGLSSNGVPFGLQLTAPRFADRLLLDAGDLWEAAGEADAAAAATAPGYEPFISI